MLRIKKENDGTLIIRFGGLAFSLVLIFFFVVMLGILFLNEDRRPEQPHLLLIMCDDMGYSDLGSFGGEILTPNIDALAESGIRFSNIKNTGRCCPSRASLMTGHYSHAVGMGWMTAVDEHRPGYRGQLSREVPTLAELLQPYGYKSYMSGKWHLLLDGAFKNYSEPNGGWPSQRGFDRSFGILAGGGGYYDPTSLFEGLEYIRDLPDGFYLTDAITEKAVQFVQEHPDDEPMFMYVAHYAPHRPLEAPEERIKECEARYAVGYDVLQQQRFDRLKEKGLITTDLETVPVHRDGYKEPRPAWNELAPETQREWVREMASYAAMIEIMDDGIGEIVDALKEKGMYEDTVILFLSDNGATREGGDVSQYAADVSNTPFRNYKCQTHHGGISTPFILHYPRYLKRYNGMILNSLGHIVDVCPTLLDVSGVAYPSEFNGQSLEPLDGVSLLSVFDEEGMPGRALFFEHETSCALIYGNWKLVRGHRKSGWLLFNLRIDPFELTNVAATYPDKVSELEAVWSRMAEENKALPLNEASGWTKRIKHFKTMFPDQDGID